jgi:hypothetical protein
MTNLQVYSFLLKQFRWSTARIWGFWHINRVMPVVFVVGVSCEEQNNWWVEEINKLGKRRGKLDKKYYGIKQTT